MNSENYANGEDFGDRSPVVGWASQNGSVNSYVRFGARQPSMDRTGNCLSCHDFGSAHVSGWNSALADGSVQTLSYTLDLATHRAFASVAGGETNVATAP